MTLAPRRSFGAGVLFSQRLIKDAAAVESIVVDWKSSTATVRTRAAEKSVYLRTVASGSGQGSVFASLEAHIEAIRLPGV